MSPRKRIVIALAVVAIGWTLMVVAYDKPEWFFQATGVIGALSVLAALVWWLISAGRARGPTQKGHRERAN